MKIAYLVFAYRNPKLIHCTIRSLSDENSSFFLHIDKKADFTVFSAIKGPNIHYASTRIPVYWGEFSGVRAILVLIRDALCSDRKYDYLVLLSGSEYAIRSAGYINNFLEANYGIEFMNVVQMPSVEAGKPISRINTLRIESNRPVFRTVSRIMAKLGMAKRDYRKYLGDLRPYSGNTWWALTRDACQYILDFTDENEKVVKYFEGTFAPEEMVFHTILGNSPFRSRIHRNFVYEDWFARGAHPEIITEKHVQYFEQNECVVLSDVYGSGEMLFARKFSDDDLTLLPRINSMIAGKKARRFL